MYEKVPFRKSGHIIIPLDNPHYNIVVTLIEQLQLYGFYIL